MKLVFDSLEELHAFYAEAFDDSAAEKPKRTRRKKDDAGDTGAAGGAAAGTAPPPMQPPQGGQQFTGFAPPAAGAGAASAFGAAGAQTPQPSPEVVNLVQRIVTRLNAAIESGQPQDAALAWFRTECGPGAAQATFDQIKTHHLFFQPMSTLEKIAKVMAA